MLARKLLIALWRYVETGVLSAGVEIRTETAAALSWPWYSNDLKLLKKSTQDADTRCSPGSS